MVNWYDLLCDLLNFRCGDEMNSYTIDLCSFTVEAENEEEARKKAYEELKSQMPEIDAIILEEKNNDYVTDFYGNLQPKPESMD